MNLTEQIELIEDTYDATPEREPMRCNEHVRETEWK